MVVYFDKENYINYLKNTFNSNVGRDTLRMIKNQLDVHLNFKLDELDEYEIILHEEFEEGVSIEFKITKGIDKIKRPLDKDSFPFNNGIYLLNDDININKIKALHSVLIGALNEEIETLEKLIINRDYSFHCEKIIGSDITPEQHLNILNLPFSTLVVVDRYIFKGPEIGGNLGLYEYNLHKILKDMFTNKKGISKLIFVYQINIKEPKTSPRYDEGPDIEKLSAKIKKVVNKFCPAPIILFIGVPAGYIDDEHDRYILSNYLRIKSGDCTVYFNSVGGIKTASQSADYYSLAFRQYRSFNTKLVTKINGICNDTLLKYKRFSKIPDGTETVQIINFT